MLGELIPIGGGDTIQLLQPKLVIGRRSGCHIVLCFPNVSSQHCELNYSDGHWQIRDLNSRNGIKVNGERCTSKWLHPGDDISIAKNHFEIQYEPVGPSPDDDEDPFAVSLMEKAGLDKRKPSGERKEKMMSMPPAARRPATDRKFDDDEDAAMDWLMGG